MKTLRLYGAGLLVALLLTLAAHGSSSPDFTFTLEVKQGSSGTTQLTITPHGGFTGTVSLSLVGAPSGVTLSPTSVNVTGSDPVIVNLTVSVDSGVAPGTYNLQVKFTGGGITETAALSLTVTASGDGGGRGGGSGVGTNWTLRNLGDSLNGVTYGNGLFVAVGEGGTILTSPDGVSWTQRTSPEKSDLLSVAYRNGRFVAVGGGTILTSP
jgi:hypothetical protein